MNPIEKHFFDQLAEGMYTIDENDRIWRLARYVSLNFTGKRRLLKVPCKRPSSLVTMSGYSKLITKYCGRKKYIFVHRIVYMHHYGDIPAGYQINHIDGDKQNNNICNLELVTPRENIHHAIHVIKTMKIYGSENATSKLKKTDIAKIMYYRTMRHMTITQLSEIFGVSRSHIIKIIKRKCWIVAFSGAVLFPVSTSPVMIKEKGESA